MKKYFFIATFTFSSYSFSQGCSDAGFCTIDNIKTVNLDSISEKNYFKLGVNMGQADHEISVLGSYLEFGRKISNALETNIKLNYLSQSLNGFTSSSLSDAFLNANYRLNKSSKATIGVKIPFTDGNLKDNGQPLPMDFQPSLGTVDLILAISKKVNNFNFSLGIQQPLTQNKNQYISLNEPYFSTNNFKRSGDVLVRLVYLYKFSEKLSIAPSLLPIYHLQNDKFTNEFNQELEIKGSQGLTLNGNVFLNYALNQKNSLELSFGSPFIVRDARPDGLTRSFVANLEYRLKF